MFTNVRHVVFFHERSPRLSQISGSASLTSAEAAIRNVVFFQIDSPLDRCMPNKCLAFAWHNGASARNNMENLIGTLACMARGVACVRASQANQSWRRLLHERRIDERQ